MVLLSVLMVLNGLATVKSLIKVESISPRVPRDLRILKNASHWNYKNASQWIKTRLRKGIINASQWILKNASQRNY